MPRYSQWFLTSGLSTKTLHEIFPSPVYGTCPTHRILLDLITLMKLGEQYKSCSSLCSLLQSHVTSYLLSSNIFLSILFSDNVSLTSSLHMTDQVSHPHKATVKKNYSAVYFNLYIFGQRTVRQKILDCTVAGGPLQHVHSHCEKSRLVWAAGALSCQQCPSPPACVAKSYHP
jgi:hypothetical protein